MKLPRGVSRERLVEALCRRWRYSRAHQSGSHVIIETEAPSPQRLAIPNHNALRIGTFNSILRAVIGWVPRAIPARILLHRHSEYQIPLLPTVLPFLKRPIRPTCQSNRAWFHTFTCRLMQKLMPFGEADTNPGWPALLFARARVLLRRVGHVLFVFGADVLEHVRIG